MSVSSVIAKVLIIGGAVVFGWYAARRWRIGGTPQPRPASRDYLAGLNFLVNDQPDRALEAFLRAVEVDKDTVEMHMALGALYRRRGEIDRAIRVHQNLVARPDLAAQQREQATYALAQDYLRAGLHDRAEKLLEQLAEGGTCRLAALRDLVRIYELQQDWAHAIEAGLALARIAQPAQATATAHYACELAQQAIAAGELTTARAHLRVARGEVKRFPRADLLRADVSLAAAEAPWALQLLRRVLEEQPELASEVLPRVRRAVAMGADPNIALEWLSRAPPEARLQVVQAALLGDYLDVPVLRELTRSHLLERPGIGDILRATLPASEGLDDARLAAVCDALRRQARRNPRYRCRQCGFSSTAFFWQCPGCKTWDGLQPLPEVDLLLPAPGSQGS